MGSPDAHAEGTAPTLSSNDDVADSRRDDVLATGTVIAERYKIVRLLGAGGMGAVYEVEHTVIGRKYALKTLLPALARDGEAVARFIREAKVAGALSHPGIVEVTDAGIQAGTAFLVMEMLAGETVAARFAGTPRPQIAEVCRYVRDAARALGRAHEAGIIHRDIKPDNLFLVRRDGEPAVKVLDFGISKLVGATDELNLTRSGTIMGTPYYMAPEQARGAIHADARSDVYALGVVLYEGIAGRRPFLGDNYNMLLASILTDTPPALTELRAAISPALSDLATRAMERDPTKRIQSAEALAVALEPFCTADSEGSDALASTAAGIKNVAAPMAPMPSAPLDSSTLDPRAHSSIVAQPRGSAARSAAIGIAAIAMGVIGTLVYLRTMSTQPATVARTAGRSAAAGVPSETAVTMSPVSPAPLVPRAPVAARPVEVTPSIPAPPAVADRRGPRVPEHSSARPRIQTATTVVAPTAAPAHPDAGARRPRAGDELETVNFGAGAP